MWTSPAFYIVISCLLSLSSAHAEVFPQSWGRVSMQGAIIDTACTIAIESRDQTIDMGITPIADIIRDGGSSGKSFAIELIDCVLKRTDNSSEWNYFQVAFDGDSEGDLFGVNGNVSGVSLQIMDTIGNIVSPGNPLPVIDITPGKMQLNYRMKLVSNNHRLKAGDYFSSIRFRLDYF